MMGDESATNVLVNVTGGLHSKPPRTGTRGPDRNGLLESAGIEGCAASGSSFKPGTSLWNVFPFVEVAGESKSAGRGVVEVIW
jgi:hypothetical protein